MTVIDLDKCYGDKKDLEIQFRGAIKSPDKKFAIYVTLYCWLSDKHIEENRTGRSWGWQYCPFTEGDKVSFAYHGDTLKGKIVSICKNYYDGDCLLIRVKLDSGSSKKYEKHSPKLCGC